MAFYNTISNTHDFSIGFGSTPKDHFGVFAKGYSRAAEMLAKELLAREYGFRDYEAYPAVFLYRHAFELYLKHVIYTPALLCAFKGIHDFPRKLWNDHRLVPLAEAAAKILRRLFPNDNDLEFFLQKTLTTASEFARIDPESFSYRYPIDRDGKHATPLNQTISLHAFSTTMSEVLAGLEAIDFGLNVETDLEQSRYEMSEVLQQYADSFDRDGQEQDSDDALA